MRATEHYLRILMSLPLTLGKGEVVSIPIEDLAKKLYCTPRNVRMILRKLVNEGLIEWKSGAGRGNLSQMTLLYSLDEITDEYFHYLISRDRMKEAMDLLYHRDLPGPVRNKLRDLLDERFGFQVERSKSATIDVLRVTMRRTFASLDPAFVSSSTEAFLLQQICNTLVTYDSKTKSYLPALAHAWEHNEDGTRWTFYLRKGVHFHHGRVLTSKDVQYSVNRLREVNSPSRWQYEEIVRIDAVSNHVISFELRRPNYLFLHFFGSFYTAILPYDVEFSARGIIGTGPFRMTEFTNQVLVLEAYEDYFRERAILDKVELWLVPEDIQNDLYQLPDLNEAKQDETNPSREVEYLIDGCQCVVFNLNKKSICHNRSFRRAMRLVFNRMEVIRELKENRIAPASSFLPEKSKRTDDWEDTLEEAKEYLRASGYSGETLRLYYLEKREFLDDARWLQLQCESIGISLSLQPLSFADYYSTNVDKEADMLVICESLGDDVEWGYLHLFQDETSFLHRFFNHEQHEWLDECLSSFIQLPFSEQRSDIMDQIEQKILEEDWILFGYHLRKISKYHPALNGLSRDSFGVVDFSKLWIKK